MLPIRHKAVNPNYHRISGEVIWAKKRKQVQDLIQVFYLRQQFILKGKSVCLISFRYVILYHI